MIYDPHPLRVSPYENKPVTRYYGVYKKRKDPLLARYKKTEQLEAGTKNGSHLGNHALFLLEVKQTWRSTKYSSSTPNTDHLSSPVFYYPVHRTVFMQLARRFLAASRGQRHRAIPPVRLSLSGAVVLIVSEAADGCPVIFRAVVRGQSADPDAVTYERRARSGVPMSALSCQNTTINWPT